MKKKTGSILCLLFFLIATLCGCTFAYTDKEYYEVREEIRIYDEETDEYLGRVKITDVIVIEEDPIIQRKNGADKNEDSSYEYTRYEAIVQMSYVANMEENEGSITEDNFSIYDANGVEALMNPPGYTEYGEYGTNSVVFAVKERSDYVTIEFSYCGANATITAPYDGEPEPEEGDEGIQENTEETKGKTVLSKNVNIAKENDRLKLICTVLGVAVIALSIVLCIRLTKKRDIKSEQNETETKEETELL